MLGRQNPQMVLCYLDPALGQEFGDLPGGERVAEVPAHGGQDHLGRPR